MQASVSQGEPIPKIRTFDRSSRSTNDVHHDFQAADKEALDLATIDIKTLTWEQRERVIALLLAKINGTAPQAAVVIPALTPVREQPLLPAYVELDYFKFAHDDHRSIEAPRAPTMPTPSRLPQSSSPPPKPSMQQQQSGFVEFYIVI